jgi:squalene-hopene/tetraprenyl-beta-curcumene cyclase
MSAVGIRLETAPTLDQTITRATEALLAMQREDGHFAFELEADATIPAEYVLLAHYLGEIPNPDIERRIGTYLRRIQADHGGGRFITAAPSTSARPSRPISR